MRLWRISNFADLSGDGGLIASGRWHSRGRRIVYLSDHPAAALLEILVHREVDAEDVPASYQLLTVHVPDDLSFEAIDAANLPPDWQANEAVSRDLGNQWLDRNAAALLKVPSAIVPFAWNWLLNPTHANGNKATVVDTFRAPFDPRLLRA